MKEELMKKTKEELLAILNKCIEQSKTDLKIIPMIDSKGW